MSKADTSTVTKKTQRARIWSGHAGVVIVNFLDPEANLLKPQTFVVITTQGNDPRQIQLGLRLDF